MTVQNKINIIKWIKVQSKCRILLSFLWSSILLVFIVIQESINSFLTIKVSNNFLLYVSTRQIFDDFVRGIHQFLVTIIGGREYTRKRMNDLLILFLIVRLVCCSEWRNVIRHSEQHTSQCLDRSTHGVSHVLTSLVNHDLTRCRSFRSQEMSSETTWSTYVRFGILFIFPYGLAGYGVEGSRAGALRSWEFWSSR